MDNKIKSVSVMRVFAMLIIVFFHSLCFYTHRWWILGGRYVSMWDKVATFLDAIDLPMFFFISGYLFGYLYKYEKKYRNKFSFFQTKAKRLMIPYLFWGVFMIVLMPSLNEWGQLLTGISHLWFLMVLFSLFIVVYPFMNWLCTNATIYQLVLFFIFSYFLYVTFHFFSSHHSFLCIHTTLYFLPFFLSGIYSARFLVAKMVSMTLSSFLLLVTLIILSMYVFLFSDVNFFMNLIILHLSGLIVVTCAFSLLDKIMFSKRIVKFVYQLDKMSMGIYIFNQITINALILLFGTKFLNIHYIIGPFIIFIIGLFVPLALSHFFNKYNILNWTIG